MKKNSRNESRKKNQTSKQPEERLTVGIDLGDKTSQYSVQDIGGEEIEAGKVCTSKEGLTKHFAGLSRRRFIIEAGAQSTWVRAHLEAMGHEVIVANPRQVPGITRSTQKSDPKDAHKLAMYGRVDVRIVHPIQPRSLETQQDRATLRAREGLVRVRTKLINMVRGLSKAMGERLPKCGAEQFAGRVREVLVAGLRPSLIPVLDTIEELNRQIEVVDERIEQLGREKYPETARLQQVWGVGRRTALCFVLSLEDPHRLDKSRAAGVVVGLGPKKSQSGESDPQLGISKTGDRQLRWLLVECAQRVVSKRAPDSDLKRWGLKLCERGGKNAKKRAMVAVARKLAVLLHKLWRSGETYDPLYNSKRQTALAA